MLGLLFGSFANVCYTRLPLELSILTPRSFCPFCKKGIRWFDNIPILSYVLLRGRCRSCQHKIAWHYPGVELLIGTLFALVAWRFAPVWPLVLLGCLVGFFLLTLSLIDMKHLIIPDELSLGLVVLGLVFAGNNPLLGLTFPSRLAQSVLSGLGGGGFMWGMSWFGEKLFHKEALGGGDIKLMAGIGAVLGLDGLIGTLLFGSFVGGLVGVTLLALRIRKKGDPIPFGPFLSAGAFVSFFWPLWWQRLIFS